MVINIVSFNMHGLNHPAKRSSLWKEALKLHADVLCIQESHFFASNPPCFQHKNCHHVYLASAPLKQKGVIIAIKDSVAFAPKEVIPDPEGRYWILVGELNNWIYTIVNIYAPNTHQIRFLKRLFNKLSAAKKGALIICGDYNITADYTVDKTTRSTRPVPMLQSILQEEDLYDVWRCQHSCERDYTFHSSRHNSYSRLDMITVDRNLLQVVSSSTIHNILWSDHHSR